MSVDKDMAGAKPPVAGGRPQPGWLGKVKRLALLGPAIIIGALQFGPGSAVSAAVAGATHGYGIIWLITLSAALMLVYTDMAIRIGLASESSTVQGIKDTLGRPFGWLTGVCMFVIAILFITGSLVGAALGLRLLFGLSVELWTIVCAVVTFALFWARNAYQPLEKVLIAAMATMLIVFTITAVVAQPNWTQVGAGFIPGTIAGDGTVVFALLGTNLSIYSAFYASYTIREKGTSKDQYRATTFMDTLPGIIIPAIMTIFIMVAGATVISGQQDIGSAVDIARILEPTVGIAAAYIFGVGIFAAGFSSVMGNAAAGGSVSADGLSLGNSLRFRWAKALGAVVLLSGVAIVLIFGGAPVQLVILVNALTLFIFPFLGAIILFLVNKRSRMGSLANSLWQNVLGAVAWLVVVWGAVQLAIQLVTGG